MPSTPVSATDHPTSVEDPTPSGRGVRRVGAVASLAVAFGLGGLPLLVGGWTSSAHHGTHRIHEISAGAHLTIVAVLLVVAGCSAARRPAAVQAFAATIAVTAVGSIAAGEVGAAAAGTVLFGIPLVLLIALDPHRHRLLDTGRGFSPVLGPLVLVAAVPLLRFADRMAWFQQVLPSDEPHAADFHWGGMAVFAGVVLAVGAVAAMRAAGSVVAAWCAGSGLAVLGVASLLWPDLPSSLGTGWGWAAVLGGLGFAAVATAEARRLDRGAAR